MTSKLVITLAALAILVPLSAQAEVRFSNVRETGKSRYVSEWETARPQARFQPAPTMQQGDTATLATPESLNDTAPASGTEIPSGPKRAQVIPVSPHNQ